jgi:hypothetical protein
MFHRYVDIGKHICSSWGVTTKGDDPNDVIKLMPENLRTLCVMAACMSTFESLICEIRRMQKPVDVKYDEPSIGMLNGLRMISSDIRIDEAIEKFPLSLRARKTLRRCHIEYVSEITQERLKDARQCGIVTRMELIRFRHKFLPKENDRE